MGEGRGIYSVAMFHVGAKSALLRRFLYSRTKSVIRPLPCSSFPNCSRLCWVSIWVCMQIWDVLKAVHPFKNRQAPSGACRFLLLHATLNLMGRFGEWIDKREKWKSESCTIKVDTSNSEDIIRKKGKLYNKSGHVEQWRYNKKKGACSRWNEGTTESSK